MLKLNLFKFKEFNFENFISDNESKTKLIRILKENNVVHHTEDKLLHNIEKYDLVISFGYRHIISIDNLKCKRPPVNLHISYLPRQ